MHSSVSNALRVLEALSQREDAGVSEIARELGLTTATTHRLIATLLGTGFATQDPNSRRYRLGPKALALASDGRRRLGLNELMHPYLAELAGLTGETVNLGVQRNGRVVYLDKVESSELFRIENELFRIEVQVGARAPLYCTALGKVLLAFMPRRLARTHISSIDFVQHTPSTIRSAKALSEELDRIRSDGYAIDRGEILSDVWCCAAPLQTPQSTLVAALSASAPRSRFEAKHKTILSDVRDVALKASSALAHLDDAEGADAELVALPTSHAAAG